MTHDPLSPAEALRTRIGAAAAAAALLFLLYSILILAQFLLGVTVGVLLPVGLYLAYRTFAALDALADAAQRIAAVREREADRESRFGSATEREGSSGDRSADGEDRVAERDRY
jgi:cobalamin synthase